MEFEEATSGSGGNGGHHHHHHQQSPSATTSSMMYTCATAGSSNTTTNTKSDSMRSTLNSSFGDNLVGGEYSMHSIGTAASISLKQQVMLNQFMSITGCCLEQSIEFLTSTNWQYQTALSLFFDDFSILTNQTVNSTPMMTPNNSKQFNLSAGAASSASIPFTNLSLCNVPLVVPCSTPVTPPNLDYLEKAFSKLGAATSATSTHQSNMIGSAANTAAAAATTTLNSNNSRHSQQQNNVTSSSSSSLSAINTNL